MIRRRRVLAAGVAVAAGAVGAAGCGKSPDEQARAELRSAVHDVGPHSASIDAYCRKHIAESVSDCRDEFANAAAYCPWPDDTMPTVLTSRKGDGGQVLRVRGKYRDGTTYTVDVTVVNYHGHPRLDHPYWLPCPGM